MLKKLALMLVLVMLVSLVPSVTVTGAQTSSTNTFGVTSTTSPSALTIPFVQIYGTEAQWRWIPDANRYRVEVSDNWTGRSIEVFTGRPAIDVWQIVEDYILWHENWRDNRWWDGRQWHFHDQWRWNDQWWNTWDWQWHQYWGWNQNWYSDWHWGWNQNWHWGWDWNWNRSWNVSVRVQAERVIGNTIVAQSDWSPQRTIDLTRLWNNRTAQEIEIEIVPLPEVIYEPDETEIVEPPEDAVPRLRFQIRSTFYTVDGSIRVLDAPPFIDHDTNRTMVPLRAIAEGLGADVAWDGNTRMVGISLDGTTLLIAVGTPLPGGMGQSMIVADRVFVPLRYVVEQLGAEINWNAATQAIYVY